MKGKLSGKVALVTGAASGIGRGIAQRFALEDAKISVVDFNLDGARKVAEEIEQLGGKAIAVKCDVGDEAQVIQAVEETEKNLGRVNILVNNAGTVNFSLLQDMTTEQWHNMFRVHADGAFYFSRAVIKSMQEGDRIINISSIAGIVGETISAHYAAAKAAIIGLTKALALEVAHRGITVNTIAPGVIKTGMTKDMITAVPEFHKEIPVRRYGTPEDIAEAAAYLASPGAGYITGQVIVVDGGLTLYNTTQQLIHRIFGLQK
ncbi:MAG: SDR family oxidoreductase [Candidatus Freyarchaeota archaeon]|nr:SDR family oxidoreductase [Candidatus Jordarchaeia archaeon]MBS7281224.1 SDR family oxidoreductase [Candidatus Jordarchaeia archaeon]